MVNRCGFRLLMCILILWVDSAWGSAASLYPAQIENLRTLVATDGEAAGYYRGLYETANDALGDLPNPIPVIVAEGRLTSDPAMIKSNASVKDIDKISALAWTWLVSKKEKYASKGEEFILAWARVNRSDGDPINETKLEKLIVSYDILRPQFSSVDRDMVDNWLKERAVILWNDPRGRTGNWESHRLKITGLIATVVEDNSLWQAVEDGFKKQISGSFLPDGESMDFKLRDAMHYHLYSVSPLLTLACVAHQRKHEWYDYQAASGASLRRAVEFIEPYALGEKSHIEFAHSKVKFDKARADAGEGEYAPHRWNACESVPVFSEASCEDPRAEEIAANIACGVPHKRFVDWESVLNYIKRGK